jgi:hypothetical protein
MKSKNRAAPSRSPVLKIKKLSVQIRYICVPDGYRDCVLILSLLHFPILKNHQVFSDSGLE